MEKEENKSEFELRRYFLDYLEKAMKLAENHPQYSIDQNNHHLLSDNAKLALSLLKYNTRLDDLVSDLKKTETFIRRFPNRKFYEENEIDQLSYIKYHYEVFIHKIHTILEVKKLALNTFYTIGLKERECTWKKLKNNQKIKSSPTFDIIESYYKSFEHIIKHRHLNTHRAYFADKKNEELMNSYFVYQNADRFGYEVGENFKRFMPKFIVDYRIKEYRKERIKYIKGGIEVAEKYKQMFTIVLIKEFFDKAIKTNVAQQRV